MKKKILAAVLAATATLAMASMGTGCAVKDWFDEKINSKDNQQSESTVDSSEVEDVVCTGHLDADHNSSCDVCGDSAYIFDDAALYTEADIAANEKVVGNWYRLYADCTSESPIVPSQGFSIKNSSSEELWLVISPYYESETAVEFHLTKNYGNSESFKGSDKMLVVYGDNYVDFYVAAGEFVVGMYGQELQTSYTITEDFYISKTTTYADNPITVKRLVPNEDDWTYNH